MPPAGRSVQTPEAAVSGPAAAVRGGAGRRTPALRSSRSDGLTGSGQLCLQGRKGISEIPCKSHYLRNVPVGWSCETSFKAP